MINYNADNNYLGHFLTSSNHSDIPSKIYFVQRVKSGINNGYVIEAIINSITATNTSIRMIFIADFDAICDFVLNNIYPNDSNPIIDNTFGIYLEFYNNFINKNSNVNNRISTNRILCNSKNFRGSLNIILHDNMYIECWRTCIIFVNDEYSDDNTREITIHFEGRIHGYFDDGGFVMYKLPGPKMAPKKLNIYLNYTPYNDNNIETIRLIKVIEGEFPTGFTLIQLDSNSSGAQIDTVLEIWVNDKYAYKNDETELRKIFPNTTIHYI